MIDHVSHSMVSMFRRCGEQFRRRYIDGEIVPPGIPARIGTGVHKGAEANSREKISTGHDAPLSVVQDAARDGYIKAVRDGGVMVAPDEKATVKKLLSVGVDTTVSLATAYREKVAPTFTPTHAEMRITADVEGLPVPVVGILDTITTSRDVRDVKTSSKSWSQSRVFTDTQSTVYAHLYYKAFGSYPENTIFDVLVSTNEPKVQTLPASRTPDDFEAWVKIVRQMLKSVSAGVFMPADPGSWACSPAYCGWHSVCAYVNQKRFYSLPN